IRGVSAHTRDRGHKVLLDEDLAALYGVATGVLVQAVKRNLRHFPADFMFQLTEPEWTVLRSRIVVSSPGHGGRRYAPYVFTKQGVAMLSSVPGSEHAIAVNIEITHGLPARTRRPPKESRISSVPSLR